MVKFMENILKVGYSKVDITPKLGIDIAGYFKTRKADGVLDNLYAIALTLSLGDKTTAIISIDCLVVYKEIADKCKELICAKTGISKDAILIHGTHTHTGPQLNAKVGDELVKNNVEILIDKIVDSVILSLQDQKPAKMGYGIGKAPNISFIRRYKMKDGTTKTNPGVNNPDIVGSKGEVDENVNVIRFDRDGAETIVLANFGTHPDTIGGNKISGDWPSLTRNFVEKAIDNTKCIFLNGAEGDVNHVNVFPRGGDLNGMFIDFDDVARGYSHAKHMARVVAGAVMQVYEKVNYVSVDSLNYCCKDVEFYTNKGTEEQLVTARKYVALHDAGRDEEIPYKAMMLITVLAESKRMLMLENAPEKMPMTFTAISIGKIALFGIPGEPFTDIGRGLKQTEGFDLVLPCCLVNSYEGYFPMKDSYDEGGYEGKTSRWQRGTGERIIEVGQKMLKDLIK